MLCMHTHLFICPCPVPWCADHGRIGWGSLPWLQHGARLDLEPVVPVQGSILWNQCCCSHPVPPPSACPSVLPCC